MKIAIVIATYQRADGKSPIGLKRALTSIENQTHQDYKVFVIGDKYEDDRELYETCWKFQKVSVINLAYAAERDKYPKKDYRLFCSGGCNASLIGIDLAINDGFEYVCHLDHDDWWEPDHLFLINQVIEDKNPLFVCTLSTHFKSYLPEIPITNKVIKFTPSPAGLICSSVCIKYSDTSHTGNANSAI